MLLLLLAVSPLILAQTIDRAQLGADLARFQEMAKAHPEDPAVNHDLGLALELLGRPAQAIRHYYRALNRQPQDAALMICLGRCERQTGNMDSAIRMLEQAVRLAPENMDGWYELAMARADLGLLPQCREALQKILSLNPPPAREGYIRLYIAAIALSEGNRETALQQQAPLKACDPGRAETLTALLAIGD